MAKLYGYLLTMFPNVHHEVAVPTAMRILSRRTNATPAALQCNGGTIGRMHNERFGPSLGDARTAVGFCAHRLNLSHPAHQQVVEQMMHDRW